jgi:outer membrane immunogenic protein
MRKYLIFTLAALTAGGTAFAQSSPWSGFHIGVGFGAGATVNRMSSSLGAGTTATSDGGGQGVLGSLEAGYDHLVAPDIVVGIAADVTFAAIESRASARAGGASGDLSARNNIGWSLLARAGLLVDPWTLLYVTTGYTGQNVHTYGWASAGAASSSFSRNDYFNGWTIGPGIETLLGGGWSTRLEYRYTWFGERALDNGVTLQPTSHTVRAAVAWRFNDDTSGPARGTEIQHDWTAFYVGLTGGVAAQVTRATASAGGAWAAMDGGGQGLLGGLLAGVDYQFSPQAVVGLMTDVTWSGASSTSSIAFAGGGNATVNTRVNMGWNVLARIGWLSSPSTLWYAAAGYSGQTLQTNAWASVAGTNMNFYRDDTVHGWTIGPGIEAALGRRWSTRLEYRYSQFEEKSYSGGATTVQPSAHNVRAGIAYKFPVQQ